MSKEDKEMIENENSSLCVSALQLPYDHRSLDVLRNYISSVFDMLSASSKDKHIFSLAGEEVLSFVLLNHVSPFDNELIMVKYSFSRESEVKFEFQYMGIPIREERVASFEKENASEENLDKLWYHLVESMMDKFQFINLGNDGWRIIFSKKIEGEYHARRTLREITPEESQKKNISDVSYRFSVPTDADALVELTHKTYAYSFPEPEFYFSEHLSSAIRDKTIVSVVAELNGEILGHTGVVHHSNYPRCAEIGMLMVNPEYQGTRLTFYLSKKFQELIQHNNKYQKDVFTTISTTAHKISQHMVMKMAKLYPVMIMLSACPSANYDNTSKRKKGKRETFVFGVALLYESESTIYLPEIHHSVMNVLFEQLGATVRLSDQEIVEYTGDTNITIDRFDLSYSANIVLNSCAKEWTEIVRKSIYALRCEGVETIIIMVPAWKPLPKNLRKEMKKLNAFFTGVPIFEQDKWHLAYVALDAEIVDFDAIHIYNQGAKDLLDHIKCECGFVLGDVKLGTEE